MLRLTSSPSIRPGCWITGRRPSGWPAVRLGDSVRVGRAVDVRGHYYQQVSNQTLAQPLLERAERLLADAPPQVRGTNYYHLGWLYDELSQATRALRYYRRAYALARQVRDVGLQASVLNSWSSVYPYPPFVS